MDNQYQALTIKQLKEKLKLKNLKLSGNKSDLIKRLQENDLKTIKTNDYDRCDGCGKNDLSCRCGAGSPWY